MVIRYLFSGFDYEKGFSEELTKYLRLDITETKLLLFIASSPDIPEKTDRYVYVNINWFEKIGLKFDEVKVIDNRISVDASKELIKKASCIVLMGGNTLDQIGFVHDYHLQESIKNYNGIVCGISAGAINMEVKSLCSKDEDFEETFVYEGLGLVNFTIEPHFSIERVEFISRELYPLSKLFPIYGLCDESAIRVENEKSQVIGEIYKIEDQSMERI